MLDLQVALRQNQEEGPPPFRAIAVLVTAVLAGAGLLVYARPRKPLAARGSAVDAREGLILAVAKIDQALPDVADPTEERHMLEQRAALMSRLRGGR